ncbi:MAG: Crp/Fnr family transcriptional regulator [Thermodesulfobacteriota bacterium]
MNKTKPWYISTNKIFSSLKEEDKTELLSKLKEMSIKKKAFVYTTGDRADTLYILKEGRIKITHLAEDGRELTIEILEPGDIFGELSLAGEEERETNAEALEDSFICAVKRRDFEEFISKRPQLSLTITKWMGGRLRRIENRFENMIFQDVRTRLISILMDLAQKYGIPVKGGRKITIRLSHQEIANLIGATRETVTLELNNMKRSGDIMMDGKSFIIPSKNIF